MMKALLTATLLLTMATGATAGTYSPGIDARQANQKARIQQGVQSGELTRPETARLVHQQVANRALEHRLKADGQLTAGERARMHHRLDHNSRSIYRQKHDRARRGRN